MRAALLLFLLALAVSAPPARAAAGTDSCTNVVTSLPFTISTPGNWCLATDLANPAGGGSGIQITASHVVLDCNHMRMTAPTAADTTGYGIIAAGVDNVVVRRCHVQGFWIGVFMHGRGNVVEDSRFIANTTRGIHLQGGGNIVRRNLVRDIGGATGSLQWAMGISVYGSTDVIDNTVSDIAATAGSGERAWGIYAGDQSEPASQNIRRNRVRGVVGDGAGETASLDVYTPDGNAVVRDNLVVGSVGYGIRCWFSTTKSAVTGNVVLGLPTPLQTCADDGGNTSKN